LPQAAVEAGAASGLGTGIQVPSNKPSSERLTAPAAMAEDTEKTTVFLYSKEKLAARAWRHYWPNVTL
jgi:hypothetical protein